MADAVVVDDKSFLGQRFARQMAELKITSCGLTAATSLVDTAT